VRTESRSFWIKFLTVSLPHKLLLLSTFMDGVTEFGREAEGFLRAAQNLLLGDLTDTGSTSLEFSSVQSLVYRLPAFLKAKRSYSPREKVNGLRVVWKLEKEFAETGEEVMRVGGLLEDYRAVVKELHKRRQALLDGKMTYLEGSANIRLQVQHISDDIELGAM
jgi:hypothetical protein